MKSNFRFFLLLVLSIFAVGFSQAQTASPQAQTMESFLMSYIDALNTRDYYTAYTMMDNRTDTYEQFVAGYQHTTRIVAYFGSAEAAAGSTYATTILLGFQDDGTIETYYGYFQLHSGQLYDPIRNNGGWVLGNAHFELINDGVALPNAVLESLLESPWQDSLPVQTQMYAIGEMSSAQSQNLLTYYDLVNFKDFATAYPWWLTTAQGLSRSYAPAYNSYVNGYVDTHYVTVYTGAIQATPTNLPYLQGYLPTVLVSEHTDGSFETYSGCYAMGAFPNGKIGIVNGRFTLYRTDAPTSQNVFDALNALSCATLNIGL